ncbi:FMN-dependent NADH-azoreductase [Thalassotalea mangrovi]|uniref:FMN dependent NADH:quinone oxidoreductase n=2 Tax=Thalassotalea mangrovi TaxID=2572245 RepID=A0A4U1B6M8_9GAMM|nr:FMN-dependent NADH-azoreductase [Thalassotalea mangrovi]
MNNNILLINTSLNAEQGNSSKLAAQFVANIQAQRQVNVSRLDLNALALPHLDGLEMAAWMTADSERSEQQQQLAQRSDSLIQQVQDNDLIVIGMPMYNFGVPSVFKAWIDRIARAGVTFRYTENGPEGLLTGKKVVIVAARGGAYVGTDLDTQTAYLRNVFAFLGIKDIEFVYAEGLAMENAEQSMNAADNALKRMAQEVA